MQGHSGYSHEKPVVCHTCGGLDGKHLELCLDRCLQVACTGQQLDVYQDALEGEWMVWLNTWDSPSRIEGVLLASNMDRQKAVDDAREVMILVGHALLKLGLTDYPVKK